MKYDVTHDNLLDVMLLNYLQYSVTDSNLTPEQLWMRVTDAMQHMSQQGIAEFILAHVGHESSYLRVWNLRQEMWKAEEEAKDYERQAERAGAMDWDLAPPPEAEEDQTLGGLLRRKVEAEAKRRRDAEREQVKQQRKDAAGFADFD